MLHAPGQLASVPDASPDDAALIASILGVLRERTGVDFSRYRAATVRRRIFNRMISVGADSLQSYLGLLRSSPDEATCLLNRIAIKVSRFYRNRAGYDLLRTHVLPRLAARARPLRLWSAGCGCGEEPYSLAMLLEEAGLAGTVEASDLDPAALEAARAGRYPVQAAAELPRELAARYLSRVPDGRREALAVRPEVRARVRFSRLDLLAGARPGDGGFDLVSCRNVLIYLQADMRDAVFGTLLGALSGGGFLFLGEAEWPPDPFMHALESCGRGARVFHRRQACAA